MISLPYELEGLFGNWVESGRHAVGRARAGSFGRIELEEQHSFQFRPIGPSLRKELEKLRYLAPYTLWLSRRAQKTRENREPVCCPATGATPRRGRGRSP